MALSESREEVARLRKERPDMEVIDTIELQIRDYISCSRPSERLSESQFAQYSIELLDGRVPADYGSWVYYPWNRTLVHLLSEREFRLVRTNRNQNKITAAEQEELLSKTIGLIGLSVGHAVAHTLAMESGFGELRIADFDVLDLSNLNRIRSAVYNIGIPKTVLLAREIAELDPYLQVKCYHEGVTDANLDEFTEGLDLLIDECDSIDVKIKAREVARSKAIPVIMETSDRGMLDIERYDLDQELPILHGLVEGLSSEQLAGLSNEEKIPYVHRILELDKMSERLRESMSEIGRTLSTWPQLGADVMHGGGTVALVSRLLLTGRLAGGGRFRFDSEPSLTGLPEYDEIKT